MYNIKNKSYAVLSGIIVSAVIIALQIITKQTIFDPNPYNSYMLQARAWLDGHLDLGKDYSYLELAIYNSKYFVSFPPFPSYLMLPFALFGFYGGDSLIALACAILGAVYSYKLAAEFTDKKTALFWSLFVTIGSNLLFTSVNAWVWFIAQSLAFTLTVSAFYCAVKARAGAAFTLWACAVGCRPFQIIYIFVILFLLYNAYKRQNPFGGIFDMIKKHIFSVTGACCIAVSYMLLNYMRFGNIFEFGHNYLPEFTRVETGQFNLIYIKENFKKLFRLPIIAGGKIEFQNGDGFCMFMASPVIISFFAYWFITLKNGSKKDKLVFSAAMALFWVHLIMITAHKTMGGAHYGNRYVNDTLPLILVTLAVYAKPNKINFIPFLLGLSLNIYWILKFFIHLCE